MNFTNEPKNMVTLTYFIKQGVDPKLQDLKDFTFNDVILPDGSVVKNMTFAQFQNTVYTLESKNITTLTNGTKL